jgi:hypothetical protein
MANISTNPSVPHAPHPLATRFLIVNYYLLIPAKKDLPLAEQVFFCLVSQSSA